MAESLCRICAQIIGYDTEFFDEGSKARDLKLVHAACLEREVEQQRAARQAPASPDLAELPPVSAAQRLLLRVMVEQGCHIQQRLGAYRVMWASDSYHIGEVRVVSLHDLADLEAKALVRRVLDEEGRTRWIASDLARQVVGDGQPPARGGSLPSRSPVVVAVQDLLVGSAEERRLRTEVERLRGLGQRIAVATHGSTARPDHEVRAEAYGLACQMLGWPPDPLMLRQDAAPFDPNAYIHQHRGRWVVAERQAGRCARYEAVVRKDLRAPGGGATVDGSLGQVKPYTYTYRRREDARRKARELYCR